MVVVGVLLIVAALLCSSELFRRGVWADDREIKERSDDNSTGCGLLITMLVLCSLGLFVLMAAGAAVIGGG